MKLSLRCQEVRTYFLQGGGDHVIPGELRLHLDECESCRAEWDTRSYAHAAMKRQAEPPLDLQSNLAARASLMARIRQEEAEARASKGISPLKVGGYSAAVGLAAVGAAWIVQQPGDDKPIQDSQRIAQTAPNTAVKPPSQLNNGVATTIRPQPTQQVATIPIPLPQVQSNTIFKSGRLNGSPNRLRETVVTNGGSPPSPTGRGAGGEVGPKRQKNSESHPSQDDLTFLNAAVPNDRLKSVAPKVTQALWQGDDFVTVPYPQIAANNSPATHRVVREAVQSYENERAIVDERLFHKMDLALKGADLKELLETLSQKTGVRLFAQKELEDWKVTVLVKGVPARDMMRQVVRLFNLEWRRHGEEGKYRYELIQTLKQRLAEEELKRQDEDQMLLNVVWEMESYLQYKDTSPEELKGLVAEAKQKADSAGSVEELERWRQRQRVLNNLTQDRYKESLALFAELTPDQLLSLRNGSEVQFSYDGGANTLPKEVADRLRNDIFSNPTGEFDRKMRERPLDELDVTLGFRINRKRPDRAELELYWRVVNRGTRTGFGRYDGMLNGQPDHLREPGNRAAHAAFKSQPEYQKRLNLTPKPSSVVSLADYLSTASLPKELQSDGMENLTRDGQKWIDSADYLEALHKQTDINLISDYYTRVYPASTFTVQGVPLLDSLDGAADALKAEWTKDGNITRFRRFNYYAEREMDIPNQRLKRWAADRLAHGFVSLDSLAEMTEIPYRILSHKDLQLAMMIKYGMDEAPLANSCRRLLELYASLDPLGRQEARSEAGVSVSKLMAKHADNVRSVFNSEGDRLSDEQLAGGRYHIRLREPGKFRWMDVRNAKRMSFFPAKEDVIADTRDEAIAQVEKTLKAEGRNQEVVESDKWRISGPGGGIWAQAQFGDYLFFQDYGPFGGVDWSGKLGQNLLQ